MFRMCKADAVLSALMKEYTIPCHDRGHINVMLVLQSCTDSLRIFPALSIDTFPTSSDGTYDVGNIKVEENIGVIEECFISIKKGADTGIKQVEIPEDITFPGIKSEPDEVTYVCVCVCLLVDTFCQCPDFFLCSQSWPFEMAPL